MNIVKTTLLKLFSLDMTQRLKCAVMIWRKSLVAKWLQQASQWHEVCSHNPEGMSSNPGWVKLGVRSRLFLSQVVLEPNILTQYLFEDVISMATVKFIRQMSGFDI